MLYQWSEVRLQGRFVASQFAAASETQTKTETSGQHSDKYNVLVILGAEVKGSQADEQTTDLQTVVGVQSSVGLIRMNAILDPRHDIGVPRPRQVTVGPSLQIDTGPVAQLGPANQPTGRTIEVVITYTRSDGKGIPDRELSIDAPGAAWSYKDPAKTTTGDDGSITVLLQRTFVGEKPDTSPIDVVVSVRKGLVSASATVTF